MPFQRPTLQELSDRIETDIKSRLGVVNLIRRSILKVLARVYAGAIHMTYGFLEFIKRQLFVTTADSEFLDKIGLEIGLPRKAATFASGNGTATGVDGTLIGTVELENADGDVYTVETPVIIANGIASLTIIANAVGTESNQGGGTTLTFVSAVLGVDETVTIDANGIADGTDPESDAEYQARLLLQRRLPPNAGASFDYERWAKEVPGVTRAWAIPQYNGIGTIGVAFVRDNDDSIIPNESQREVVRQFLIQHENTLTGQSEGIPVTAEPGLIMIELSLQSINFEIPIIPNTTDMKDLLDISLADFILDQGRPGGTLFRSQMDATISDTAGEVAHRLVSPSADIGIANNKVPVLGEITLTDY